MSVQKLPKLIMLYGPPGSGKGVQTDLLTSKFSLQVISWGESFREFAQKNANDPSSLNYIRAKRVREKMLDGSAILTEDMMYILESKITKSLEKSNQPIIMDKPGSLPPEASWISNFLVTNQIPNCLIHLTLPYSISVQRIAGRFYIPSDTKEIPYSSYQEAKLKCPIGQEPLQREDDASVEIVKHRYYNLYEANRKEVLKIYQNNNLTKILTLEADNSIEKIHQAITNFLTTNY